MAESTDTSEVEFERILKLLDSDTTLYFEGYDGFSMVRLQVDIFFLSGSSLRKGDPIQVYDGTGLESIQTGDVEAFKRIRSFANQRVPAKKPFALARIISAEGARKDITTAMNRARPRYATNGHVVLNEVWNGPWEEIEDFATFDGSNTGSLYVVKAAANLGFEEGYANIDAPCISSRDEE